LGQRHAVLAAGALAVMVLGASLGLSKDLLDRTVGAAGHAVSWLHGPGDEPGDVNVATAPREAVPPVDGPRRAPAPAPPAAVVAPPAPHTSDVAQAPAPERSRPLASTTSVPETASPPREVFVPGPTASRATATREEAPSPPKPAVAAVAVQKAPEFRSIPRMELSRQRDSAGRTVAVTLRLTDAGGRPLSDADVRIRRRLGNGDVRETRLQAGGSEGSYRGPLPARVPNADGLIMRVTVGQRSHEVPLAE
jgi:hypothetical protein